MNLPEIRERVAQGTATNDDAKYLIEAIDVAEFSCTGCPIYSIFDCTGMHCIDAIMIARGKAR